MKKIFVGLLTAALALVFASCANSGESSPSAEALNTFNTEGAAWTGAADETGTAPAASGSADASFEAGTLPPQSTASSTPTAGTAQNTQTSTPRPAGTLTPAATATPRPATPAPVRTPTPTPTPTPTAPPVYTPEPTTTPLNEPVPTAVIGEPKEHYDDIKGINGKNNRSSFPFLDISAVHADNYIYFVGGEYQNEMAPYGTYRLDTRTDKLEFFSEEEMREMFIAGEWLYYEIYDSETHNYYSCRMHSDGTARTRLSYLMPDVFCCVDEYLYYIEEGSLYRRLISGEDQPVLEREPEQGNKFSSICTDGQNLYIVSESADGARIYKQSGSESEILWTGDNIGSIVYDSGYIWGESHWAENRAYILWKIDAETGEGERYGLCEDYTKNVFYNIVDGTLYIYGINCFESDNIVSMDVNFENKTELGYLTMAGNINGINSARFFIVGDYFCFAGPVGKGVYDSIVLFKNDGSNKYMVIDTDFPSEDIPDTNYPRMTWMTLD